MIVHKCPEIWLPDKCASRNLMVSDKPQEIERTRKRPRGSDGAELTWNSCLILTLQNCGENSTQKGSWRTGSKRKCFHFSEAESVEQEGSQNLNQGCRHWMNRFARAATKLSTRQRIVDCKERKEMAQLESLQGRRKNVRDGLETKALKN